MNSKRISITCFYLRRIVSMNLAESVKVLPRGFYIVAMLRLCIIVREFW